jgi:hypothetical protein
LTQPEQKDWTMRRTVAGLAVLLCALPALTACGGSDSPEETDTGPKVIEVTIEGESVTPNGERVEVAVGQQVDLEVTADAPGEIHVHSSPEQELEYEAGTHTVTIEGIDKPGTVDVESHNLDKVIVQLEVR